jgi:hypothetical protein
MKQKVIIRSGPTFQLGVMGVFLFLLTIILAVFANVFFVLLLIPAVSFFLSWNVKVYHITQREIQSLNYMFLIPLSFSESIIGYDRLFIDYEWKRSRNSYKYSYSNPRGSYQQYFDVQLRNESGDILSLENYTDHREARKKALQLADVMQLPLVDEYADLQQSAVQRRKRMGHR